MSTDERESKSAETGAEGKKGCGCAAEDPSKPSGFDPDATGNATYGLPKVTFSTFILSLSSSCMVQLGEVPEPENGQMMKNLPMAKHTIDILSMLKDKTSKCLDPDEARLLEGILYELRMKYVMLTD